MVTQEYLKEALFYNEKTGEFSWLERPLSHFSSEIAWKSFNKKHLGKKCRTEKSHKDNPYISVRLNGKSYKQHRLAFLYCFGYMPEEVDHVNGIQNDNRIENLRAVTRAQNSKNLPTRKSSSLLAGVSFSKGKYRVRISRNGNEVALGTYSDYFLACGAKKSAEHKFGFGVHHGRKQNQ